jgi:hypothetical protein
MTKSAFINFPSVNILSPHLGIKIPLFWISTFFGIFAVSMIHVTIGEKLDQMTSADDFNLFSIRNILLLGGVCCAVLVPVFVRKYSAAAHTPLEEDVGRGGGVRLGDEEEGFQSDEDEDELPRVSLRGATRGSGGGLDGEDEEGRAAYVARAWRGVELDADVNSDGEGDGPYSEQEEGPTFEDRREQNGAPTKSRKAIRVLGAAGQSSRAPSSNESYIGKMGNWINSSLGRS